MKKCIGILCCTLLFGVVFLFNTEGELPLHWFRPFLRMQASKAVIKERSLILFNVKVVRKKFEFHCSKLVLQLKMSGVICHINQALLKYGPHVFSHINGIVKKHHGSYKAFLDLDNRTISHIQIACDPFSPKIFRKFAEAIENTLKPSATKFFVRDLKLHIAGKHIYDEISELSFSLLHAKGIFGYGHIDGAWLKYSQKIDRSEFQDLSLAPVLCNGNLNMQTRILRRAFVQAQTFHKYLGDVLLSLGACDVSWGKCIPVYAQLQSGALVAEGKFSDLKRLELDSGFIKCTSADLLQKYEALQPYNLLFQHPLYLRFYGGPQHLNGVFDTKDMTLNLVPLRHIYSTFEIENKERFSWDVRLYADKMHPRISGFYNTSQDLGEIYCVGRVAPELTYAFKRYLPDWWEPFFKQFHFKTYPYANFNISFKVKEPRSLCFGFASVKNAHFKQSKLQQFNLNFGNCPGYCWLRLNQLKMNQKRGACEIHWPYQMPDSQKERWIFNGNGNFGANDWLHLLQDFVGKSESFEMLKHFNPHAEAQANFAGVISSASDDKDHLTVGLKIPKGFVWDFPVCDFSADYSWHPGVTQIKNIQAKLSGESPITADVSWVKEHLNFQFKGQHIATKPLLNHPMFSTWTKSIPKDNLETYDGVLELDLQGQGEGRAPLRVSGNGHLSFQNPNLSQIHILGPLTRLFSKKFKWLPVVSFDKLISDFSFTEKQISTQSATLLGPSTRADLRGHIDLAQQKIQGTVHFSFLDYNQLNFPVMRHFVQIFQPISKGFSAKVSGTFSDPNWSVSFNPFRFALPK